MRAATTAIACTPRALCGHGQQQNAPIFSRWVGFLAYILGLPNNHLRGRTEPQLRDLRTTIRRVTVLFIFLGDWSNQVPTATGNQVHTAACMVFQFAVDGMFFSSMWMGSNPWLGCSYVVSWMKSMLPLHSDVHHISTNLFDYVPFWKINLRNLYYYVIWQQFFFQFTSSVQCQFCAYSVECQVSHWTILIRSQCISSVLDISCSRK